MMKPIRILFTALACTAAMSAMAQSTASPPVIRQNMVQLSATGAVEVAQDLLVLSLTTTREGADANEVQQQLKVALDAALAEARKAAQPGLLEVRTGNFSLYPRHGRDGRISTWLGSAELVLEGRDFARISATAGKIQTLTVGQAGFALSREARARVEGQAQAMAIERFKAKATEIARGFGFASYALGEVVVSGGEQPLPVPRLRSLAAEAKSAGADAPLPVEAGRTTVQVTVSGSVQLK